jgi:hypothetical protein
MSSSFKVGTPVYWVEDVYNRSLVVNELNRRRGPTKEVKTARIKVDTGSYNQLPEDTILTTISEEDYRGLNSGNINSDGLVKKYPAKTLGGRRKRRNNRTKRVRK